MKNNDDNSNVEKGNIYKPIYYGNWEEKILYDLAIWKNGLAFKNINFTDSGKPVIKIAELKNGITAQTKFTQDVFDDSVYLKKGDMLFSWSGNPETSIDVFYYNLPDGWLNQHIFKIQTKDSVFYRYFFYILKYLKPNFIAIATNKQTTGLGHVTINDLKKLKIKLPPLEEQKKIASILSSLDDKIELNNRMNKILEEMAQTIFKEWFVNFNFPSEDGKPYKDSGGKMIESELGAIPEGWEITNLEEICNIYSGYSYSSKDLSSSSDAMVTIKNFERNGGFKLDGFKEIIISDKVKENHYANLYDVIVAHTDITQKADIIGNPILLLSKGKYNNLIISMDLVKVTLKNNDISNTVLYNILSNINFKNHCLSYSSGTTVLHLSKKALPSYKLAYPNSKLLKKLSNILEPIYKKISIIYEENQKLDSIRDTLLPKLMSGEIRVK